MLIIRSQHVYFTLFHIFRILERHVRFWFAAYVSLWIEIPNATLWTT